MYLRNILVVGVLLSSAQLFAQQLCPQTSAVERSTKSVDLRKEMPEVRDQDSTGLCFAFAAADLTSHYLYKNARKYQWNFSSNDFSKKATSLSPIGMASVYNSVVSANYYAETKDLNSKELAEYNKKKKEELAKQKKTWQNKDVYPYSGHLGDCVNKAFQKGFCFEKDAPSESFSNVLAKICSEKNICARNLQELLTLIYNDAQITGDKKKQKNYCDLYEIIKVTYPSIPTEQIDKILQVTSRDKIFYQLAEASCDNKIVIPFLDFSTKIPQAIEVIKTPAQNSEFFPKIDSLLDAGNAVGIIYSGHFLQHMNAKPEGLDHASTLVGKRFDPKTCEVQYILRNTWGPNCGLYRKAPPEYYSCMQSSDFQKPKFFQDAAADLKKKITALTTDIDLFKKQGGDVSEKMIEKDKLEKQIAFYLDSKSPSYPKATKFCETKYPVAPVSPKFSCDDKTGHLYVNKSLLKEFLYGYSYIQ